MESDDINNNDNKKPPRKMKFIPKAPPRRRVAKPEVKIEAAENADNDADTVQAEDLLRRFNESSAKLKAKAESKGAPAQVAFGFESASSSLRSYGFPKGGKNGPLEGGARVSGSGEQKEYKEPWDYYSYYPVTLPMRRPYSGNPELLNEEEFGEPSESRPYDENSINPGVELGLVLPSPMPMIKRCTTTDGHEEANSTKPSAVAGSKEKICSFNELPAGFMGKLQIYRSGAVKLKLGDILYDISPGMDCVFAQDVVAVNTVEKNCCVVGELSKRAIITPDLDSALNSLADL